MKKIKEKPLKEIEFPVQHGVFGDILKTYAVKDLKNEIVKKKYIEIKVLDKDSIFLSIICYPIILNIGLIVFFFNSMRYALKLLFFLIVSIIPIINVSIINEEDNVWSMFDEFKFNLDNIKYNKRFEIKEK